MTVTDTRKLTVLALDRLADGVLGLSLADPAGLPLPAWTPGAHVDLHLGNGLIRQYSLCGDPAEKGRYRVAVLREANGRGGSAWIHDHLTVGETLQVSLPRNNFALEPSPALLLIAGGIGITPLLPMIAAAEAAGTDWRLLYGGRARSSMAFRDELARHGERVTVVAEDESGLLDLDAALGEPLADTLVYCCGPEGLLDAVAARTAGWPDAGASLRLERFHPKAAVETGEAGPDAPIEIELARTGRTVIVPAGQSILDVLEDEGVDDCFSSCREGTCGTCETDVLGGEPDHRDSVLSPADRESGRTMLICVSRARTPRLVLDL
ncbi:PDR/VanB family oxidoreductase [Streptacidiphilus neutrinimicus]|uniref:PDR/VanB family oxidoreductase n=1 Tax=Streptacidiphilus neutrinimicus TaxID=105420 RepID=UPI0005A9CC78|nr:PDR/VanB family oxidoreductase [Streptacidiphilus neutrinimicus]